MSLINCKDCKHEISKSAKTCPNCGKKQKEFPWKFFLIVYGVFFVFFIFKVVPFFVNGSSDNQPSSTSRIQNETRALTANDESKIKSIIINSDDYSTYNESFMTASKTLVMNGLCSLDSDSQFTRTGGWFKSVTTHKNEPVYFTYCNPSKQPPYPRTSDRIYLNVETNALF